MTSEAQEIIAAIMANADPVRATHSQRFFKTGKGEYGEGDKFLGLTMPQQRIIAKKYTGASLSALQTLLKSPFHELRMTALLICVYKYQKAKTEIAKKEIYDF